MWFKRRKETPPAPVEHAGDTDFDTVVLASSGLVVVDFWASWCAPCKMMEPILDEVAAEYADREVRVVKVNTDEAPETAGMFEIRSIPTIIFFRDGEPLFEMVGIVPKPVLVREIESSLL
ncbi:MAG: thioredoxin [Gemmatimonadota bacterium]